MAKYNELEKELAPIGANEIYPVSVLCCELASEQSASVPEPSVLAIFAAVASGSAIPRRSPTSRTRV